MSTPRVRRLPVLLRTSARYVLVQRGFVILILALAVICAAAFTHWFATRFPANSHFSLPVGVTLGIVLFIGSAAVHRRISNRIDRAFFRGAYDASHILQSLVTDAGNSTSRPQLAGLLQAQLRQALHPRSLYIYLQDADSDSLRLFHGDAPANLGRLPVRNPLFDQLRRRSAVVEVRGDPAHLSGLEGLTSLDPECLVPMIGNKGDLLGLVVLGVRLSGESYSAEDKRLLVSVATQSATTLANVGLAEQIAEKLEGERLAEHELAIARNVQRKLLPQRMPSLASLEYVAQCKQARAVGGDYYDFLPLSRQRLMFVLADVAGKGISAALLMANLQATLRSYCGMNSGSCSAYLPLVNRQFYETTESCRYATLVVADYDDMSRRLQYANCGHNPPLVFHRDQVRRLEATATVLGLFDHWECSVAEVQLAPDDLLVFYTDGITDAMNGDGLEFGESRLIEAVTNNRDLSIPLLLKSIFAEVETFSRGAEQHDDMTIIVARAR